MQQPSTSTQPTTRTKVAQFARSRTGQWIILGLCIGGFIGVIYASNSYFYGHERFADLTGCYDSSGNAYIILVRGQDVDSQGDQCKAIQDLAKSFGFVSGPTCSEKTTITNPNDPSSFITAQFCDVNSVYSITVQNPPTTLAQVPTSFGKLINLESARFQNAFYGSEVVSSLFALLQVPRYFKVLNLSGSESNAMDSKKVLNGTIPALPPMLTKLNSFFRGLGLSNNNLTGGIPENMADSLRQFNVSNNPRLTGPLPTSVFESSTKKPDWSVTRQCQLDKTQLCIPPSWTHQPACIRDSAVGLKVCGGDSILPINPTDPDPSNTPLLFGGSSYQQLLFGLFVMTLGVFSCVYCMTRRPRNSAERDSGNNNSDVELEYRRSERVEGMDANLPTYFPPTPGYLESQSQEGKKTQDQGNK